MKLVKVRRRVPCLNGDKRPIPGKYGEVWEKGMLLSMNKTSALVQLPNGDTIKRKLKDIAEVVNE